MPADVKTYTVHAEDEWSQLQAVIVGRADHSCFPNEPRHMIEATMPEQFHAEFKAGNPFPSDIVQKANEELDQFVNILQGEGIQVYRPEIVDWAKAGGYTAAMPRDGLLTVGNSIIEACFSWGCRKHEIDLAFSETLHQLANDPSVSVIRAPKILDSDTIYDGRGMKSDNADEWAINDSRPAFDAADFMRFGRVLIGQLSNVTNMKGVAYLRSVIPLGYEVQLLEVNDPHAMHIDATILPLRHGLLVYNPHRVTEASLRKHSILESWVIEPYPFVPTPRAQPPLFMTSAWLSLNVLSISEQKVVVEAQDGDFSNWVKQFGIQPILCPFQHVNSLGGSFHCATVDLVRSCDRAA